MASRGSRLLLAEHESRDRDWIVARCLAARLVELRWLLIIQLFEGFNQVLIGRKEEQRVRNTGHGACVGGLAPSRRCSGVVILNCIRI